MPVQNAEIAEMFDQAAELLEIKGENPFRARAYRRAARVVETLPQSITGLLKAGQDLSECRGSARISPERSPASSIPASSICLTSLKRQLPGEIGEIAALPGLGPKRVKLLVEKLGVRTIAELRRAAKAGRLHETRGLGTAVEKKVLAALAKPAAEKRFKLAVAEAEAEALAHALRQEIGEGEVVVAGSYRRRRDTVGDLDVLVTGRDGAAIGDKLAAYENVADVTAHGPTRTAVILRSGLQVDLRVVPPKSYGAALLYFTGSKAHNIALRGIANEHGWKLNEYGLFKGDKPIAGATEEEIYGKLGLAYVPPELREDRGEIALAQKNQLPRLVKLADMRGDLHAHSTWSDGTASLAEMAAAAKARGYEYIAITDHSRRVTVAHGLDPRRLAQQIAEIDRLNEKLDGITVLKGIEVDILADGQLDLPDTILSRLDIVVASVHSYFDLTAAAQTERIVRAMDNRHLSILGHPTGRLIGEREPYALDLDRLIAAAGERGCFLEINSQPERLDLNDIHIQMAKDKGVKLAISTDAHSTDMLAYVRFGIDQARRGWLTRDDVINTRSLAELRKLLKR